MSVAVGFSQFLPEMPHRLFFTSFRFWGPLWECASLSCPSCSATCRLGATSCPSHPLISASSVREARGWTRMTEACCPSLSFARKDIHNGSRRARRSLRILPNATLHTATVSWPKLETGRGCICLSARLRVYHNLRTVRLLEVMLCAAPGFYANFLSHAFCKILRYFCFQSMYYIGM